MIKDNNNLRHHGSDDGMIAAVMTTQAVLRMRLQFIMSHDGGSLLMPSFSSSDARQLIWVGCQHAAMIVIYRGEHSV